MQAHKVVLIANRFGMEQIVDFEICVVPRAIIFF